MALLKNFFLFSLWFIVILYLSFSPLKDWPQSTLFDKLYVDKLVHIFMYSMLSFFLLTGIFKQQNRQPFRYSGIILSVCICAAIGISIEILQPILTAYRKYELPDMVANTIGAITGWQCFRFVLMKHWFGLRTAG